MIYKKREKEYLFVSVFQKRFVFLYYKDRNNILNYKILEKYFL